ncbi:hypothetical protein D3C84_1143650 [compost metagenome]
MQFAETLATITVYINSIGVVRWQDEAAVTMSSTASVAPRSRPSTMAGRHRSGKPRFNLRRLKQRCAR